MKRRRSKPSIATRLRVFWIFIVVVLLCAGYAGFRIATWPGFNPGAVAVLGAVHVRADEVRKRAAIAPDRNVWLINKGAAESRVATLPWVQAAQIHRALPARVAIVVIERVPAACVQSGNARSLVDANAHVIETTCAAAPDAIAIRWPGLGAQRAGATLEGATLAQFLSDVSVLRDAHLAPASVDRDRFGGLEATLRGGLTVRFGDDRDLVQKAALVDPILQAYGRRTRDVAAIDLRAPATPVVEERGPHK